jgi:hypothetical protein
LADFGVAASTIAATSSIDRSRSLRSAAIAEGKLVSNGCDECGGCLAEVHADARYRNPTAPNAYWLRLTEATNCAVQLF